jgi:hypothetical protein
MHSWARLTRHAVRLDIDTVEQCVERRIVDLDVTGPRLERLGQSKGPAM